MAPLPLHEGQWEYVRTLLPIDLDESARRTKALVRCRNVPDAAALMRMALAYAVSDLSLKDVAAWASAMELAEITGPGLFYRLRESETWLEQVLAQVLGDQLPQAVGGWPVRVVDATVINGPGEKAVQWRAHILVDPSTGGFRSVELTDDSGGEKLARHPLRKGELVLGDRAYGTARGVYAVWQAEAHVVVRFNPATLRTCDSQRQRIFLKEKEAEVPPTGQSNSTLFCLYPQNALRAIKLGIPQRPSLGLRSVPSQPARAIWKSFGYSLPSRLRNCRHSRCWGCTGCVGKLNYSSND
jgi:hypothetical protein